MRNYIVAAALAGVTMMLCSGCGSMKVETGQHEFKFKKEMTMTLELNYLLYIPEEYNKSKKEWPLILFLHGAGERGNDINKLKKHGPPKLIEQGKKDFPFIIVSPQCPGKGWWTNEKEIMALDALLNKITAEYRVDKQRIYLTGLSMGGFGSWGLAAEYPDRFAAVVPICGGGDPKTAKSIAHLPIWVFHGGKDKTVPIKKSEIMVEALKKAGNDVKFTVYPDAGHDSWTKTYNNPELYKWLLSHNKSE